MATEGSEIRHGDISGTGKHHRPEIGANFVPMISSTESGRNHVDGAISSAVESKNPLTLDQQFALNVAQTGLLVTETAKWVRSAFDKKREERARGALSLIDSGETTTDKTIQLVQHKISKPSEELADNAHSWGAVEERHYILKAVGEAQKADKVNGLYVQLLFERTGLNQAMVDKMHEEVPAWPETNKLLTKEQQIAAEAVSARLLIDACIERVKQGKPEDDETSMRDVAKLLKAHIRVGKGIPAVSLEEEGWDDQAREMVEELNKGRDKIFDKARVWDDKDRTRKVRAAGRAYKKLDDPQVLSELTGIDAEMLKKAKINGVVTTLGSGVWTVINESISHLPGLSATQLNVGERIPEAWQNYAPWIAGGATIALYGVLLDQLVRTSRKSADLLTKTGVGLDPFSKLAYDFAVDNEEKRAFHGALKFHGSTEMVFFALGLAIAAKNGWSVEGWEDAMTYFNTASVVGSVKNVFLRRGIAGVETGINYNKRRKLINEMDQFLPNK